MAPYQTRKPKQPFFHSWFFLVPLAVIFVLFAKGAYASFQKKHQADIEQEKYEEKLQELIDKKHDLQEKIDKLETDRGREDELRTRFNVVKNGETMIRIIEEE